MADLNAELLRALNGPAPQYKKAGEQAFDFLEGEQGKLFTGNHVMTDSGLWVPQKGTSDGAVNTQLTGSIVERSQVVERGIYNEDITRDITIPGVAKMLVVEMRIRAITGDMPNLQLITYSSALAGPFQLFQLTNKEISNVGQYRHFWGVPVTESMYLQPSANNLASEILPVSVGNLFTLKVNFDGEFDEGQGIDLEVRAMVDGGDIVVA